MNNLGKYQRLFTRRGTLRLTAALVAFPLGAAAADRAVVSVFKDPNCDCCTGWVRHLKEAGFAVKVDATTSPNIVRKRLGVPPELTACHTAEVGGYVLEGHVPVAAVLQLLAKRPKAVGLAVPGMPIGSPGMEGGAPQKYEVVIFGATGQQPFMQFVGTKAAS